MSLNSRVCWLCVIALLMLSVIPPLEADMPFAADELSQLDEILVPRAAAESRNLVALDAYLNVCSPARLLHLPYILFHPPS
jgi:hypothetical protein